MHSFVLFFKSYVYIISCSICLTLPVLYHISLGVEHFICLLFIPMRKGPKLMKLGVGASDRVEKDEDSPFLRICYPGYCTLGFVPRKQKKAFGAFTEAPNSKTSSRNPPKCYNLYSASIQKQSLFP